MKYRLGFTLIELLVVVAIIAVLSAVGLAVFQNARTQALDASYRAQVVALQDAAEQCRTNSTNDQYCTQANMVLLLDSRVFPTASVGVYAYTRNAAPFTSYCVISPALLKVGTGNCSACAAGVATFAAGGNFFCAKNRL